MGSAAQGLMFVDLKELLRSTGLEQRSVQAGEERHRAAETAKLGE